MRRMAALVPLTAVMAASLLFSTTAWGQTPSPEPTATPTPTPTPEPAVVATPVAEAPEEPEPSAPDKDPAVPEKHSAGKDDSTTDKNAQGGPGPIATAAKPKKIVLYASPKDGMVGREIHARGKLSPNGDNRWVKIVNARTGYKIKSVKTSADGTYSTRFTIRRNTPILARWKKVKSEWRHLSATPKLKVRMTDTKLFARTTVYGTVSRAAGGKWVKVRLRRLDTGRIVARRSVRSNDSGYYRARFRIKYPGTYRGLAVFTNDDWRKTSSKTSASSTPLPSLSTGSSGTYVQLLETRLAQLRHHLAGRNSYYGADTADAVMAFNKVNGRGRVGYVTSDTWRALAFAERPQARYEYPTFHIEVNQSKQVLFVVRRGKVRSILHVSTGAPSTPTYDGTYQFWGKIAGYSPKRLYYPSYFHGGRAIHGWQSVPPYNASHGCVRVPMWAAKWIYGKTEVGDTIRIYH